MAATEVIHFPVCVQPNREAMVQADAFRDSTASPPGSPPQLLYSLSAHPEKFSERLKDRDDIYLEVRSSEERRKRKGLTPRVVILPDWDMSDEDRFDEHQTRRRTKAAAKKRRTQPQSKGVRR